MKPDVPRGLRWMFVLVLALACNRCALAGPIDETSARGSVETRFVISCPGNTVAT